ncbi:MAG: pilus assembly protein [Burkholderiales bacterium]
MIKNRFLRKWLACTLIAITANPLTITAAYARDSDIFLSVSSGTVTAEPNIMFILDTSDTMNIPEAWREYTGAYDSHVEYLWNDTTFVTTSISTAAAPVLTPAGSWAGAVLADRQALRTAAINYAAATEAGDPGARSTYRNYNDAAWVYWLEAGALETDVRLRSPSFNRWRGHMNTIGGNRGGITYTATGDFRAQNKCRDSGSPPETSLGHALGGVTQFGTGISSQLDPDRPTLPQGLTPSTVYAPSAAPRNTGRYLNQVWRAWNPFDNVRFGREDNTDTNYSMTSGASLASANGGTWIDWRLATPPVPTATGSEDCNAAGGIYCRAISSPGGTIGYGNDGARVRALNEFLAGGAASGTNIRDSWPAVPNHADNIWYLGYVGQPIRVQVDKGTRLIVDDSDDSRSRWVRLNADLGGFVFADTVRNMNTTVLTNVLAPYDAVQSIPAGSPQNRAWLGNRTQGNSSSSDWHSITGTNAYVDSQVTRGRVQGGSLNTVDISGSQGANGLIVGNWIHIPGAGVGGIPHLANITAITGNTSFTISPVAAQSSGGYQMITRNLRLTTVGTAPVNRCQVSYTLDADQGLGGNQAAFTATTNNDGANRALTFVKNPVATACIAGAATPVGPGNDCTGVVPTNKAPNNATNYITARYSGCSWSGRQSLYVEGVGTYYYGGNCGAASSCRGVGFVAGAASCATAGSPTTTFSTSSYQVNNNCTVSGLSNLTAGSTPMAGAVLNSATNGCGNKADVVAACNPRENGHAAWATGSPVGGGCQYYAGPTCPTDTWTTAASTTTTDYQVFENINRTTDMVHDCQADDGTVGNPGLTTTGSMTSGSTTVTVASTAGYTVGMTVTVAGAGPGGTNLTATVSTVLGGPPRLVLSTAAGTTVAGAVVLSGTTGGGYLGDVQDRLFATAWSATANLTVNSTAPYRTTNTNTFAGNSARSDQYSVNYLNWKFGPKGPNSNPIGRKTRLQVAKDALTELVATTDGVRFGLMVYNRTAGCLSSSGAIDAGSTSMFLPDNPGFSVGAAITIVSAGPASANLNTTITAINTVPDPLDATNPPTYEFVVAAAASTTQLATVVTTNPCTGAISNEGGNVARRILRMGANSMDPDYANRASMVAAIQGVLAAARTPITETLYEAYRYFAGRAPRFGTSGATAVVGGLVTAGRDTVAVCSAGGTQDCPVAGVYRSPMLNNPDLLTAPAGCQKNFVVLINDGTAEDDWAANAEIKKLQYAGALGTVATRTSVDTNSTDTASDQFESGGLRYGPPETGSTAFDGGFIWLDELAYFMSLADVSPGARNALGETGTDLISGRQSVVTYTIGFAGGTSPVLSNAAIKSGATYVVAEESQQLRDALTAAITAIRDWNPTASAPTVPISALNRAESAAEIYLGFFQPDPTQSWKGTVKKFGLSISATDCGFAGLCIIGQTLLTKAAPNPSPVKSIETIEIDTPTNTQQIIVDRNAVSYWGPTTLTDGSNPDNGGTGYQLLNTTGYDPSTRNVYTLITGGATSASLVDASNRVNESNAGITKTMLGNAGMSDSTRATLINYILGGEPGNANCADASAGTACTQWRAWPHFDVQHSKPAVVQYDIVASPVVQVLYYMSNDGLLHAIDTNTGQELWAFLIEEALPKIAGFMADISGPQVDGGDGSITVHIEDTNADGIIQAGERVWLYFGLRRGGRSVYALDVTNRLAPVFKWKATAQSGTGQLCVGTSACTGVSEYDQLGQTWSAPKVAKLRVLGTTTPAIIFGGGYDTQEDGVPAATSANTMGKALYVVNADTGNIIKSWGPAGTGTFIAGSMSYAIPSDAGVYNSDLDSQNYVDRVYIGDMGGQVWRFDINDADPTLWRGKLLANLSDVAGQKRKIFFPPVLVKQINPERYDAIYVGTGDREHPRLTTLTSPATVADAIFNVMDRDVGLAMSGAAAAQFPTDFLALTSTELTGIDLTALGSKKGWYRSLDDGEKVINTPTIAFQKLRFGTYAPLSQANACTPPGEGRINEIDALTGGLFNLNTADGLNAGDRYFSAFTTRGYISDSMAICIGGQCFLASTSDTRLFATPLPPLGAAGKIYWYMEPEQ